MGAEASTRMRTVKRALDAYARRDADEFLRCAHPDVEWSPTFQRSLQGAEGSLYRGEDGIRRLFSEVDEILKVVAFDVEHTDQEGDRVVLRGRFRFTGASAGATFESPTDVIIDFDGDLIRRVETHTV